AALHAATVEMHGARTAVAGVATNHGAGLAELLAQIVDEEHAGFDVVGHRGSVDGQFDSGHGRLLKRADVMHVTLMPAGWHQVGRREAAANRPFNSGAAGCDTGPSV